MPEDSGSNTILPLSECWELVTGATLGRLVTSVENQPLIFPVNFAVQNRTILFRTAGGTKLVSTAMNKEVLFEVDDHDGAGGWSVIIKGQARAIKDDEDIAEADRAQLLPWAAAEKTHYVRIKPLNVTGRRFVFGKLSEPPTS